MSFSVGDSVVVKSGVADPDFENDISGWQGRIEEIDDEGSKLLLTFDCPLTFRLPRNAVKIMCDLDRLRAISLAIQDGVIILNKFSSLYGGEGGI